MALEKPIIKRKQVGATTFEYKPRDLTGQPSKVAQSFVNQDALISPDFKISELIAQQAGITQLEDDAHRDKINAQVLDRLKEVQEKAYREGYELGLIEGTEKAFQESKAALTERMGAMESILGRIEELKGRLLIDNEATFVRLIFLVAKKIAMRDLEENRDAVWSILQHVVGGIKEDERVNVRLNSADMLFLESLQEKSGKKIESLKRVRFTVDDAIKPGGCLIETDFGSVDATLDERVERTWAALESRVPHQAPDTE